MRHERDGWTARTLVIAAAAGAALGFGCQSPVDRDPERSLRRAVVDSARRELAEAEQRAVPVQTERESRMGAMEIPDDRMPELEQMAGPGSYEGADLPVGRDLLGQDQQTVSMGLAHAIQRAVEHNLGVQFATLGVAIAGSDLLRAESAFDWTLFGNVDWANTDEESPSLSFFQPSFNQRQTTQGTLGVRRELETGGQLTVQTVLGYSDVHTPGFVPNPNPSWEARVALQVDQPLLRGFGADVALAQVRLSRNAERNSVASLKRDLITVVTNVESAYWSLVQAHENLLIQQRLLERGENVREKLRSRRNLDVKPAQWSDAVSSVENRRADLLRAQNALRLASDEVKALVNDPDLTIGSETLVIPTDRAADQPVRFSLADSLRTAILQRPEMAQAILALDDSSIRQIVADNGRLPRLDLRGQVEWTSMNETAGRAYGHVFEGDFINYFIGVVMEYPLGNRGAEATYRGALNRRRQAVLAYQDTVRSVVKEVKAALRDVVTNYELIEQTRIARIASAENLRALRVESELLTGLTVEILDNLLRRQEQLAAAERQEVSAVLDYNLSVARLYSAMGTALERNRIEFEALPVDESDRSPLREQELREEVWPGRAPE